MLDDKSVVIALQSKKIMRFAADLGLTPKLAVVCFRCIIFAQEEIETTPGLDEYVLAKSLNDFCMEQLREAGE